MYSLDSRIYAPPNFFLPNERTNQGAGWKKRTNKSVKFRTNKKALQVNCDNLQGFFVLSALAASRATDAA